MSTPLDQYRRKRDPERTPESFGGQVSSDSGLFVVQQHAARAMHYDLRLEMGGVLKSWAVPKGPSIRSHEKRLAVHVEDHPVEYADFEGVIPPDNYGAGAVILWDQGWYRVLGADPLQQLERGTLEIELQGYKLQGLWMLVRMGVGRKEWLLFSKNDADAGAEPVDAFPGSILSGLTVSEREDPSPRARLLDESLRRFEAPSRTTPRRKPGPMLASPGGAPFSDPDWLFEIKYDGIRVLARRRDDTVTLLGRKGDDITRRYPEIVHALRTAAPASFLIDGEIVAMDDNGRPSFQRLQRRMHLTDRFDIERAARTVPVRGVFFDFLEAADRDLRGLPLTQRKECLALFLPQRGVVQYSEHVPERGEDFYRAARENRLEGTIGKRADSRYVAGRTRQWLKFKCQRRQEFVIGGYTRPGGSRPGFGALHLGLYRDRELVYVSKVGTGFDGATLRSIHERLQPLERGDSPFSKGSPAGSGHRWVEPALVCEVEFTEWTEDGGLRHPSFLGLRDDKEPEECRREEPAPEAPEPTLRQEPPRLAVTNPDKVFWPDDGYTKRDLVAYYEEVAPLLLPYLRDRPLVLTRFPDGIDGKAFFQKDAPDYVPGWVATRRIYSKDADRDIDYFIVNDIDSLRYVANLGTIPLHVWASRLDSLERPDWLVMDLDPKGAPFTHVVRVARTLKRILEELDVTAYIKTSGATGLHILVPMGRRYLYEQCRTFARLLALAVEQRVPDIATVARPLHAREGKVYVDFGQNGYGRTIAGPFSVRPLPGAPVSCPLRWSEVTGRLDPGRYTVKTAIRRFKKNADPLLPVIDAPGIDMAAALARLGSLFEKN